MKKEPKSEDLKPNGLPINMFIISIDDGYVEYSYQLKAGKADSIDLVYRKIRKAFRDRKREGVIRVSKS